MTPLMSNDSAQPPGEDSDIQLHKQDCGTAKFSVLLA